MDTLIRIELRCHEDIEYFCRFSLFVDLLIRPAHGDAIMLGDLGIYAVSHTAYWEGGDYIVLMLPVVCEDEAAVLEKFSQFKNSGKELIDLETSSINPPVYYLLYRVLTDAWGEDLDAAKLENDGPRMAYSDLLRVVLTGAGIEKDALAGYINNFVEATILLRGHKSVIPYLKEWASRSELPSDFDARLLKLERGKILDDWVDLARTRKAVTKDTVPAGLAELAGLIK